MADRDALIKGFLRRKPPRAEGSLNLGNEEGSLSPGRLKRANKAYFAKGRPAKGARSYDKGARPG